MPYTAKNVVEAISIAETLRAAGEYDLFRGQLSATWDCVPSLFRIPVTMQGKAAEAARRYLLWVAATPGLEEISGDADLVVAIAQHYGIPTRLLDFTTAPGTAGFFATDGDRGAHAAGAIILVRSSDVAEYGNVLADRVLRVLRPRLDNLWRMTAQQGVFVETEFPSLEYLGLTDRITFLHDESTCGLRMEDIYPPQSPLEILLRQYFDNESALKSRHEIEAMVGNDNITHFVPGTWENHSQYFRPGGLDRLDSWRPERIASWLAVRPEPLAIPEPRSLSLPYALSARVFGDAVRDQVSAQLSGSRIRTKRVRWHCEIEHTDAEAIDMAEFADLLCTKLGLLWDGLRRLPYRDSVLAEGMGLCAAILRGQHGGAAERDVLEELLGPVTRIGFGAADGSGASAYAASASLQRALRRDLIAHAAPEHREVFGELRTLLQLETRPQYLYEFHDLSDLFGRQIAPIQSARYGNDQVTFFSPANLQSFGVA